MGESSKLRTTSIGALLQTLELCVADVGARGSLDPELRDIAWACHAVGFEPEPDEAKRLAEMVDDTWARTTFLPVALGEKVGDALLHLPHGKEGGSLLPHNVKMVDQFGYDHLHQTCTTVEVRTTTLDALQETGELGRVDYLKIDVEGAELQILQAATRVLKDCVAIKVECSFLEQRVGQPLIWEVIDFLQRAGYQTVDISDLIRWRRRPIAAHPYVSQHAMCYSRGQVAQCDVILLRDVPHITSPEEALRLVVVAAALGYFDYAVTVLRSHPSCVELAAAGGCPDLEAAIKQWSRSNARSISAATLYRALRTVYTSTKSYVRGLPPATSKVPY